MCDQARDARKEGWLGLASLSRPAIVFAARLCGEESPGMFAGRGASRSGDLAGGGFPG
jgi:hypothetical protein